MSRLWALVALLVAVLGHVSANISTSCKDGNTNWVANYDGTKDHTAAPLSGCQEDELGLEPYSGTTSKYKIGGKGSADIMGISAGGESKGCSSVSTCMYQCQALCCMATGCKYAMIFQAKDVDDYFFYKETKYTWFCELYSKATYYAKDDCTICRADNKVNCASIASSALGLSSTDYKNLVAVQNASTCPSSGRRSRSLLQPTGSSFQVPDVGADRRCARDAPVAQDEGAPAQCRAGPQLPRLPRVAHEQSLRRPGQEARRHGARLLMGHGLYVSWLRTRRGHARCPRAPKCVAKPHSFPWPMRH